MSRKKIITGTLLLAFLGTVMIFLYFCNSPSPTTSVCRQTQIESGDLILSVGDSFKSRVVKTFEKNTDTRVNYSHIGVFLRNADSVHIVHMSIDDGFIKRENLKDFIENNGVIEYDIYRMEEPIPHPERLYSIIDSVADTQMPFDRSFDMESDDSYYCTEFIYKTFLQAGITSIKEIEYKKYLYPNDVVNSQIFIKQEKH